MARRPHAVKTHSPDCHHATLMLLRRIPRRGYVLTEVRTYPSKEQNIRLRGKASISRPRGLYKGFPPLVIDKRPVNQCRRCPRRGALREFGPILRASFLGDFVPSAKKESLPLTREAYPTCDVVPWRSLRRQRPSRTVSLRSTMFVRGTLPPWSAVGMRSHPTGGENRQCPGRG